MDGEANWPSGCVSPSTLLAYRASYRKEIHMSVLEWYDDGICFPIGLIAGMMALTFVLALSDHSLVSFCEFASKQLSFSAIDSHHTLFSLIRVLKFLNFMTESICKWRMVGAINQNNNAEYFFPFGFGFYSAFFFSESCSTNVRRMLILDCCFLVRFLNHNLLVRFDFFSFSFIYICKIPWI